ncbi:unnamed protein product [Mytilus coruscus]|uniref:Uncharacterized protein n=1 Tax=Mytilus coruscus TaxID=42192 RepID=A0A6J8E6N5_MYTCO|nr:unnamed protein product [Mytilus coruscus]
MQTQTLELQTIATTPEDNLKKKKKKKTSYAGRLNIDTAENGFQRSRLYLKNFSNLTCNNTGNRPRSVIDTALTALILSNIYGIPVPKIEVSSEENEDEDFTHTYDTSKVQTHETCYMEEISHATYLLHLVLKGDVTLTDINQSNALNIIRDKIEQFRQLRSKHRTAKLWFQYMDMICILRDFIKAERTCNWHLHL